MTTCRQCGERIKRKHISAISVCRNHKFLSYCSRITSQKKTVCLCNTENLLKDFERVNNGTIVGIPKEMLIHDLPFEKLTGTCFLLLPVFSGCKLYKKGIFVNSELLLQTPNRSLMEKKSLLLEISLKICIKSP